MSDPPINLNRYRKSKARAEARTAADANAVKFGRTKAERDRIAAEARAAEARIEGHRREPDDTGQ